MNYACTYLGNWEQELYSKSKYLPSHYWRYVDDIHGLENFKEQVMKPFYAAFPDYYVENDIVVADDTWASATGYLTGTHKGTYLNIEPTGKLIKMQFSDFWLIKDGKFSENFVMVDNYSVLKQMGITFK